MYFATKHTVSSLATQQKEDKNFRNLKSNLSLFEDEDKLLRCRGRIGNAPLPYQMRFPVISPREARGNSLLQIAYEIFSETKGFWGISR